VKENDRVRIKALLLPGRARTGSVSPQVGDIGTIRYIVHDPFRQISGYVVECKTRSGELAWMAEFTSEELEKLPAATSPEQLPRSSPTRGAHVRPPAGN
jgi:hypothetical protein